MKFLKYFVAVLVLLMILFIGKGLLTPSISYKSEVTVDKSVEETWAVMSDVTKLPDWIKGFKKSELVSGTANTVGAVSNIYIEEGGEEMIMQETITAIKPKEQLAMKFTMDFMDMDYEMLLKEKDGKTYIETETKTVGNGMIAKSIVSFMTSAMKTQEDENLNNLKQVIEANTKNYFPEPQIEVQSE